MMFLRLEQLHPTNVSTLHPPQALCVPLRIVERRRSVPNNVPAVEGVGIAERKRHFGSCHRNAEEILQLAHPSGKLRDQGTWERFRLWRGQTRTRVRSRRWHQQVVGSRRFRCQWQQHSPARREHSRRQADLHSDQLLAEPQSQARRAQKGRRQLVGQHVTASQAERFTWPVTLQVTGDGQLAEHQEVAQHVGRLLHYAVPR